MPNGKSLLRAQRDTSIETCGLTQEETSSACWNCLVTFGCATGSPAFGTAKVTLVQRGATNLVGKLGSGRNAVVLTSVESKPTTCYTHLKNREIFNRTFRSVIPRIGTSLISAPVGE